MAASRKPVRMRDVAAAAGVSTKTVSDVVNGTGQVRDTTRERVLAAIERLGYLPNPAARRLNAGSSGTVTLAMPQLGSRHFAALASAVFTAAEVAGIGVVLEPTGGTRSGELAVLHDQGRISDGILLASVALHEADLDPAAVQAPLVLLGDRALGGQFDATLCPNIAAATAATELLLHHGCRRIAVIGAMLGEPSGAAGDRYHGYQRAGAAIDPRLVVEAQTWNRATGFAATETLLARQTPFDALLAMDDALAQGALHALRRGGLDVPRDVQVIGIGDTMESAYCAPTLSTVAIDVSEMAARGLGFLRERIAGGAAAPRRHEVAFQLVERESTGHV